MWACVCTCSGFCIAPYDLLLFLIRAPTISFHELFTLVPLSFSQVPTGHVTSTHLPLSGISHTPTSPDQIEFTKHRTSNHRQLSGSGQAKEFNSLKKLNGMEKLCLLWRNFLNQDPSSDSSARTTTNCSSRQNLKIGISSAASPLFFASLSFISPLVIVHVLPLFQTRCSPCSASFPLGHAFLLIIQSPASRTLRRLFLGF